LAGYDVYTVTTETVCDQSVLMLLEELLLEMTAKRSAAK